LTFVQRSAINSLVNVEGNKKHLRLGGSTPHLHHEHIEVLAVEQSTLDVRQFCKMTDVLLMGMKQDRLGE